VLAGDFLMRGPAKRCPRAIATDISGLSLTIFPSCVKSLSALTELAGALCFGPRTSLLSGAGSVEKTNWRRHGGVFDSWLFAVK
jgi:hypothetical protein